MNNNVPSQEHKKFKITHAAHDPFFKIQMEQHRHRTRTIWMIVGIIALSAIAMVSYILINYSLKYRDTNQYFDTQRNGLNAIFENLKRVSRDEGVVLALEGIKKAANVFYNTSGHVQERAVWSDYIAQFQNYLENNTSTPTFNKSFIAPSFLGKMVAIPAGSYNMGARANEPDVKSHEFPRHTVKISKPFWASEHEVTFSQWWRMGNYSYKVPAWSGQVLTSYDFPVSGINWHNAMRFCALLNNAEKEANRIPEGYEYRLPTEAEWEYMARAGTEDYYYWGDSFIEKGNLYANIWDQVAVKVIDNISRPEYPKADSAIAVTKVGSYAPNAFDLYDMIGNVSEWCYDWYNPLTYRNTLEKGENTDPVQDKATIVNFSKQGVRHIQTIQEPAKIIRGGNWATLPNISRCASRDFAPASTENSGIGFRIVLAPILNPTQQRDVDQITIDSPILMDNCAPSPYEKK